MYGGWQWKGFDVYMTHDKKYNLSDVTLSDASWLECSTKVSDVCLEASEGSVQLYDFEQHLDGGINGLQERDWLRNPQVAKIL